MIIWNRKDNTPLLTLCSQSLLANKRLFPLQAWTVFLAFFPLCVESIVVVYLLICYLLVPRFDGKSVHPFLHIRSPPARRRFHHRYGKCPKNFLLKLETILYLCVIPNSFGQSPNIFPKGISSALFHTADFELDKFDCTDETSSKKTKASLSAKQHVEMINVWMHFCKHIFWYFWNFRNGWQCKAILCDERFLHV